MYIDVSLQLAPAFQKEEALGDAIARKFSCWELVLAAMLVSQAYWRFRSVHYMTIAGLTQMLSNRSLVPSCLHCVRLGGDDIDSELRLFGQMLPLGQVHEVPRIHTASG